MKNVDVKRWAILVALLGCFLLTGCGGYIPKGTLGFSDGSQNSGNQNDNDQNNNDENKENNDEESDGSGPRPVLSTFSECTGNSQQHQNFNFLFSTMELKYAVFHQRLPVTNSWRLIGEKACPNIFANMTDNQLYDVLIGMIKQLNDGHTWLTADSIGRDDDTWTGYQFSNIVEGMRANVQANYIDGGAYQVRGEDDMFAFGRIGSVGYINITGLESFTPGDDFDEDIDFINEVMPEVLNQFQNTTGIVMDLRQNEGGYDDVALEIAKYFAGAKTLAWSKQFRLGPGYEDLSIKQDFFVEQAVANNYANPVIVLTSGETFSAGETLVYAMESRPNVMTLGEKTSGHHSDIYDAVLPNGWELAYSGEKYFNSKGVSFEGRGIPPNISVPLDAAARAQFGNGVDVQLQEAVNRLQ